MTQNKSKKGSESVAKKTRKERLAAELRANLKKRKAWEKKRGRPGNDEQIE